MTVKRDITWTSLSVMTKISGERVGQSLGPEGNYVALTILDDFVQGEGQENVVVSPMWKYIYNSNLCYTTVNKLFINLH